MNKGQRGLIEVALGLAAAFWVVSRCEEPVPVVKVKRDTVRVVKRDTVPKLQPVHDTSYVVRYVRIPIRTTDTVKPRDSVDLAIEQKVYRDSDYTAWVSGVMPSLDSLNIFRRRETVTIRETITRRERAPRLSVGVQAGYGFGIASRRVEPYVGLGITWRVVPP